MALGSLPPLQVGAKPIEDIVRYVNKYLRAPQGGQQVIQNITIFGGIVAGSLKFLPDNSVDVGQLSPIPLRPRNVYAATAFVGPVLDTGAGGGNLTLKRAGSAVATFAAALATFATAVTISGAATLSSTLHAVGAAQFDTSIAVGASPALTGAVQLGNAQQIKWRNGGGSADVSGLFYDSSNNLWLGDNNAASIQLLGGSGGVAFQISTGGGTKWFMQGTGNYDLMPWNNFPGNDNLQSIGSSSSRLKSLFAGTSVISPVLDSQSGDLTLKRAGVTVATFATSAVTINQPITSASWQATAIDATHGGTAQTAWTLGDLLYASAANTLAKLAGNIVGTKKYLSQIGTGAVSAAPAWAQVDFADLSGSLASSQLSGDYTFPGAITVTTSLAAATAGAVSIGTPSFPFSSVNSQQFRGYNAGSNGVTMQLNQYNGTFASPTATALNDILGKVDYQGYDGVTPGTFSTGASFRAIATEAWTSGHHGALFRISTVAVGATSLTGRYNFDENAFYPVTAVTKLEDLGVRSTNVFRNAYAMRYYAQGTALATTDFAVSSGWGTSPTKAITGTDMGGRISITAKATTSANPTVTLTFHDGTFTNIPSIVYCGGDTTGPAVGAWLMTTASATAPVFTWIGTPTANHVYVFDWAVVPS